MNKINVAKKPRINIVLEIVFISTYNQAIDNFPGSFDLDIYYEDLPIIDGKSIKTPNPENYDEIWKMIELIKGSL